MGSKNIAVGDIKNGGDIHVRSIFGGDDVYPQHGTQVAAKYMGSVTDQREMSVLGKAQVLRVRVPRSQLTNTLPPMIMCRGTFNSSPSSALDVP
jgi:hypothetical protein